MSASTKFVPILQKSGPGRWWRWQNKITGTATYATFGNVRQLGPALEMNGNGNGTRVPNLMCLDSLDHEVSEVENCWDAQAECRRPLCSVKGMEFPLAADEMLGSTQYSSTILSEAMKIIPMLPEKKLESIIPYACMSSSVMMTKKAGPSSSLE